MFRKKTVDEVIGALTKAQQELVVLAASLRADADRKRQTAGEIIAQANEAGAEADRAARVAERVSALVA